MNLEHTELYIIMPDVWLLALWTRDSDWVLSQANYKSGTMCIHISVYVYVHHACVYACTFICIMTLFEMISSQSHTQTSLTWVCNPSNKQYLFILLAFPAVKCVILLPQSTSSFSCNCYCIRWWNSWALSTKHIVPSDIIKPNLSHLVVIDRLMYMIYSSSSVQ